MRPRHTLEEWAAALAGCGAALRRDGKGFRFAPCPSCGGGTRDSGWVRPGRVGVIVGCNGGCDFEALARAVFPSTNGTLPPRGRPTRAKPSTAPPSPVEPPTESAPDPDRADFTEALEDVLALGPEARCWLEARALDPDWLDGAGWRSIETPEDRRAVVEAAKAHHVRLWRGWTARPLPHLVAPLWNADGRPLSFRMRSVRGQAGWLSLPGDTGRLIGSDAALASPADVLHVVEGETDWASLTQCWAVAVGVPGVTALHDAVVTLAKAAGVRRFAVWFDGDDAGDRGYKRLRHRLRAIEGAVVVRVAPSDGADANDLLQAGSLAEYVRGVGTAFREYEGGRLQ